MMKLPKRLPHEVLIAASLMLGSCDQLPHKFTGADYDRLDVADVNGRNAISRVNALESRVSDIERDLRDAKSTASLADENVGAAFENAKADRDTANSNARIIERRLRAIEDRLQM